MFKELFKAFFRNPFQKKYLPVLAGLLQMVVLTAITHEVSSVVVPLLLAIAQLFTVDKPLGKFWFGLYVAGAAIFGGSALMMLFAHAWLAAVVAAVVALLPLSIIFTRPAVE